MCSSMAALVFLCGGCFAVLPPGGRLWRHATGDHRGSAHPSKTLANSHQICIFWSARFLLGPTFRLNFEIYPVLEKNMKGEVKDFQHDPTNPSKNLTTQANIWFSAASCIIARAFLIHSTIVEHLAQPKLKTEALRRVASLKRFLITFLFRNSKYLIITD